jgi:hypothetical protein
MLGVKTCCFRPGPHQELKKQGYTVEDIPDSVEGNCDFGTWGTKPRSGIYYLGIYMDLQAIYTYKILMFF